MGKKKKRKKTLDLVASFLGGNCMPIAGSKGERGDQAQNRKRREGKRNKETWDAVPERMREREREK